MDFIGTGNRILTENFTIGYLYTITFRAGYYINSACIGKGADNVMFQRTEPDLLFNLNMDTAPDVYSIELYSGGGSTDDYETLSNKPQINNVTLSGNKSSSDLGLQSTISDLDTIRAGAAAGATAVQPAALTDYQPVISDLDTIRAGAAAGATAVQPAALTDYQPVISDLDTIRAGAAAGATAVQPAALTDYQPVISDLDTIRAGAAAGATAVQPAALADYQTKIDSSHMLSADVVDDTSTTHKFATASQLQQIETNKNNISTLSAELAKYVIAQKTLKLNPTGAGETPDVTMSQTGSSDGWWISNGVSISGISRILSICITGFGSIRETDVITPCTTNDRTQLRIATNVGTFKANATLTVQVFGLSS